MKTLKQYADDHGVKYRAAWNRFKRGRYLKRLKMSLGKF